MSDLDLTITLAVTRYADPDGGSGQARTTFVIEGSDHAFDPFEITVRSNEKDPDLAIAMAKTGLLDLSIAIHAEARRLQAGV